MNTLNFFGVRAFFTLAVLVGLLSFGGCGDSEDDPVNPTGTFVSEFKWPPGATGELWELTDADVAELLAINLSSDWRKTTEDPELYTKYYFAQLLKQFGDIPELRYIIVFDLKPKDNITIEQAIAWAEAMYRLFPSTENLRSLRFISSLPPDGYLPPQDEPKSQGTQT